MAANMPGIQPSKVRNVVISIDPQPLSITATGGSKMATIALMTDMILLFGSS